LLTQGPFGPLGAQQYTFETKVPNPMKKRQLLGTTRELGNSSDINEYQFNKALI
jgi:hypothetical protein